MNNTIITANNIIKEHGIDHGHNLNFKRATNPGTDRDFKKEMSIFYPDKNGHFKGMNQ